METAFPMVQMVELCAHMCCEGCEEKMKKVLRRVKGVESVEVDMAMQKVTVTGWAEQKKILKAARKTGRRVVLWPYSAGDQNGYHMTTTVAANYSQAVHGGSYMQHPAFGPAPASSYNYYKHGYDESRGLGRRLSRGWSNNLGEKARSYFSDDNPHACSIM